MSAVEQKIFSLFSPLPFSLKAKIVALLSQHLADEASDKKDATIEDDLNTSIKVRKLISEGKMQLLSEDEYWAKLKSS